MMIAITVIGKEGSIIVKSPKLNSNLVNLLAKSSEELISTNYPKTPIKT
jgi:hypothetical protein